MYYANTFELSKLKSSSKECRILRFCIIMNNVEKFDSVWSIRIYWFSVWFYYNFCNNWTINHLKLFQSLYVWKLQNKPSATNFWQKGDKNDLDAKEAYEALLTISLLIPRSSSWNNFTHMVKERAVRDYNFSFPHDEEVCSLFYYSPSS